MQVLASPTPALKPTPNTVRYAIQYQQKAPQVSSDIPFNWGKRPDPTPAAPIKESQYYHQPDTFYTPPDTKDPSLLPLFMRIKAMGTDVLVEPGDLVKGDAGFKSQDLSGKPVYGYDSPSTHKIVLSSDQSPLWWHLVPHEYAHQEVATKKLQDQQNKLFKDGEDMADSYADYWNDPVKYTKNFPQQAAWFQTNFLTRQMTPPPPTALPVPAKAITPKKKVKKA